LVVFCSAENQDLLVCFREWGHLETVPGVAVSAPELVCCCPQGMCLPAAWRRVWW